MTQPNKTPNFTIALINPQIPPNTGNIARLCGATTTTLHLVGDLGFDISDSALKRAGLDYWHLVDVSHHPCIETYFKEKDAKTCHFLSAHAETSYTEHLYKDGDTLVFGSEKTGLPEWVWERFPEQFCTIPMWTKHDGMRSLNLATSAGIVLYEAIRQVR